MRAAILNEAAQIERGRERVYERAEADTLDESCDIDQSAFDHEGDAEGATI
jgi:hypothetical protein